jgi:hypothetical protein
LADALVLAGCAMLMGAESTGVVAAAVVLLSPSGTDPTIEGDVVAWQTPGGSGRLRRGPAVEVLGGTNPAVGGVHIASRSGSVVTVQRVADGSVVTAVDGSGSGEETEGIHGVGLSSVTLNGNELSTESTTEVTLEEETPEVEVTVENQGESTENGITVSVKYGTGSTEDTISSIEPLETGSVAIPLVPAPTGEITLEVVVDAVPGEETTENNEAAYSVLLR